MEWLCKGKAGVVFLETVQAVVKTLSSGLGFRVKSGASPF